jgi:hypothetical protein
MTRIAYKLGLVAAVVLGVAFFVAAPAQAHEYRGRVVAPRVIVRGSNYYRPPVVVYRPPVVVTPTYPVYPYTPTYIPVPVPVVTTPTYPVYPYAPAYVPAPAPVLSVGPVCR